MTSVGSHAAMQTLMQQEPRGDSSREGLVTGMINDLRVQISGMEVSKASAEQLRQVSKAMTQASVKAAATQEALRKKADTAHVEELGERLETAANQLGLLEGSIKAVDKQLEAAEQQLQEKADWPHVAQLESALLELQDWCNSGGQLPCANSGMANSEQLDQLVGMIRQVDAKCEDTRQKGDQLALNEDEGNSKLHQLGHFVAHIQEQIASLEESLEAKAGCDEILPLRLGLECLQSQVTSVERLACSGVPGSDAAVRQMDQDLRALREHCEDKADNTQLQELRGTIVGLQSKVSGVRSGVFEVVDSIQAMHSAMNGLKQKMAVVELYAREEAGRLDPLRKVSHNVSN